MVDFCGLGCQRAYRTALSQGRTAEMTEQARLVDKASHCELNKLRALPENSECFDCSAQKPGWAVLPWGIYVCIDCAQVHRNLGRHISQTKAINTGTYLWFPHELAVMREVGNQVAARAFAGAPTKPSRDAPRDEKEMYAKQKYELRRWGHGFTARAQVVTPAPACASAVGALAHGNASKPPAGLPQAKRATTPPALCTVPQEADLISFDAISEARFLVKEQAERTTMPAMRTGGAPCMTSDQPASSGWKKKTAAVLAHFQPQHTALVHSGNIIAEHPDSFFAQYGM